MKPSHRKWWLLGALAGLSLLSAAVAQAANTSDTASDDTVNADAPPLVPVEHLDIDRYTGTWYEIAKYPNFFQRHCASDTRAEYRKRPDGLIEVTNVCKTASGETDQVVGLARPDRAPPPLASKLQVRFAPSWIGWLPMVWAHYWVVLLDKDYRYAVVSEPKRKYLWILSRTPQMDEATYRSIEAEMAARGLDPRKLVKTAQRGH